MIKPAHKIIRCTASGNRTSHLGTPMSHTYSVPCPSFSSQEKTCCRHLDLYVQSPPHKSASHDRRPFALPLMPLTPLFPMPLPTNSTSTSVADLALSEPRSTRHHHGSGSTLTALTRHETRPLGCAGGGCTFSAPAYARCLGLLPRTTSPSGGAQHTMSELGTPGPAAAVRCLRASGLYRRGAETFLSEQGHWGCVWTSGTRTPTYHVQ